MAFFFSAPPFSIPSFSAPPFFVFRRIPVLARQTVAFTAAIEESDMHLHPAEVLFAGEKPFPALPAVDHYAGAEKLMRKALTKI